MIILVALKIQIIRWGAYYDTDTNFLFFGCEIYAYSQTFKRSYAQLSEESIQMISKIKTICLPTETQFTYQLWSTVLQAGKSHPLRERVGGEDALVSNSHHVPGPSYSLN